MASTQLKAVFAPKNLFQNGSKVQTIVAPRFTSSFKASQTGAQLKTMKPFIKKVQSSTNSASHDLYDWENKAALRSDCTWVFC
jgi:hypothetical protein